MNKKTIKAAVLACGIFGFASSASAVVLDFDDIYTGTYYTTIPNGYGGLNWDSFGVSHRDSVAGSSETGYTTGVTSGDYAAFNLNAQIGTVDNSNFDFNGAFLTGAWNDGLNITVQGFSGTTMLYENTVEVNTSGPTWFDFDYVGIDSLIFTSFGGTLNSNLEGIGHGAHFVMDDFTFNESASVPAPASLVLFGLGLIGLGFRGRKKI